MRQFYEAYRGHKILSPLVREISWTKNLVILELRSQDGEREFYLTRTQQFGWTKNVLIHQIENRTYQKTRLNQTSFDTALPEQIRNQAKLAVKDEYTFDFLELADEDSERQLEQAILAKVEPFLLEMAACFPLSGGSTGWRLAEKNISLTSSSSTAAFDRSWALLQLGMGIRQCLDVPKEPSSQSAVCQTLVF